MLTLYVEVAYASFRKSYARSFAETYRLPPPSTVYGMLLSLVGERLRARHETVRLAFAFRSLPRVATTLRKLSRFKYGEANKQSTLGNAPDYVESLCGIEMLCWIDSSCERNAAPTLEERLRQALTKPEEVRRYGVVSLGMSDDIIDDVRIVNEVDGAWIRLTPSAEGDFELPIWVDHVGSAGTRWQRYRMGEPAALSVFPTSEDWTTIARRTA